MQDRIYQYEPLWGEWKVDKLIGEGSFGKVYKVKRTEFGEDYFAAVKIITIPQNETEIKHAYSEGMDENSVKTYFENFVSGLVKEIRLMSSLKGNTNIVSLEDYKIVEKKDSIGWDILIRMELLKSFMDYLSEKTLSKRDVIKLGIDMCKALELCQKANIIHRDIKPDNIFVSPHGDFKLGDFGIARQIEKTTSGLSKKGTFTYMAPEVYKGEAYNSTVDIYSLGLVLYRLLNNNRTPFLPDYPAQITHTSREESLVKRISGEAFPMPVNAEGRLAEIVLKACSFKPIDRYENPILMREALESIQYQVDEAPLIYPLGDNIENKSVNYASTNKSLKEEGNTESIFGGNIPSPIYNLATEDGKTESIFGQQYGEPRLDQTKSKILSERSQPPVNNAMNIDERIAPKSFEPQKIETEDRNGMKSRNMIITGITVVAILVIIILGPMFYDAYSLNKQIKLNTYDSSMDISKDSKNSEVSLLASSTVQNQPLNESKSISLSISISMSNTISIKPSSVNPSSLIISSTILSSSQVSISDNIIKVSNVSELINAIKSDVIIQLLPGDYNICEALTSTNPKVYYDTTYPYGVAINGIKNLKIISDNNVNNLIYSTNRDDCVLKLYNCDNIKFENIRIGHKISSSETCSAGVVYLSKDTNIIFEKCDIFGCGTTGFDIYDSSKVTINNSIIHDCLYNAAYMSNSQNISITNTTIRNNGNNFSYEPLFSLIGISNVSLVNCIIANNGDVNNPIMDMIYSNVINEPKITNCTFTNNYYK